jgi:tetratricopeptide (TPR) repeat protein
VQKTNNVKYYLASAVALVAFLVYLSALRNDFVYWDDNLYIFDNPYIRSLDAVFFRWAFLGFHVSNWHPLTWISHAVDYAIWGLNPLGHHLTNIILHAANTALVVMLAMKLLEVARWRSVKNGPSSFLNDRTVLIAAGVTGLLFGIHPLHVESVAWVSERKDLLCALFYLMSIIAYTSYVDRGKLAFENQQLEVGANNERNQKKFPIKKNYLLALGLFILAILSKPMAVTLPAVLLILDWYPFGRIRSFNTAWASIIEKLPFIVLSLISSLITILAQGTGKAFQTMDFMPLSVRALVAVKSLAAYIGKMLLPVNLLPFYPYPKYASVFSLEYILSIGFAIVATIACMVLARKQKVWLAAWGYYVITLIPVLGIIQVGGQAMADRYTYLPSLGPFFVAGLCSALISDKFFSEKRHGSFSGKAYAAAALFLAIFLSYLTLRQITVWRDSFSLWTSVIQKGDEKLPMAYVNRGAAFQKAGLLDKAVADYEMAVNLDPSDYRAYISLGRILEQMGLFDRAKEAVEKAIASNPSSHEAFRNRGLLMEKNGQFDEAIADYSKAIALQPTYFEAYNNRGLIYAKMGRFDKAIADYSEAITINPRHFNAYINRGVAFTLNGQFENALEDFNRAILLGQDDSISYYNRGMFYRRIGKNELALSDIRKACDLGNERACGVLNQLMQDGKS